MTKKWMEPSTLDSRAPMTISPKDGLAGVPKYHELTIIYIDFNIDFV